MAESLTSLMSLNTGHCMPYFGLGVYQMKKTYECVSHALKHGYRLIDTAEFYGNETECGKAIKDSGINREDIFVTSKLWNSHRGYDEARTGFFDSFKKLGLEYVDLYLIHSPLNEGKIIPTYDGLVDLQKEGYIRSVGVSNFNIHHLEGLKAAGRPTPAVNQIELHCFYRLEKLVQYCQENNIVVNGYSPVAQGKIPSGSSLDALAKKYGKSIQQIMIRWSVQKGYVTIPKSEKLARIEENAQVFDFNLEECDMQELDRSPTHQVAWDALGAPWKG